MVERKQSQIRNFVIISHIDHGKSTLADRFLELTETIPKKEMKNQYLDMLDLEREKGITIKMAPVRMEYKEYILNLIDTPGHVDFSYEVSRSLAAVEGAILLVDFTKGIQAQTISNLELAKKQNLVIIPAINKIDLSNDNLPMRKKEGRIEEVKEEISKLLNISKNEIFEISAKYGTNTEKLLEAVIKNIPPPKGNVEKPLRALIFDSKYDLFKGVIAYLKIVDGQIRTNEKFFLIQNKIEGETKEIGYFKPKFQPTKELKTGEIGYLATGIKEPEKVKVGDTLTKIPISNLEPLPGYQEPKPMIFASLFPENPNDFEVLKKALNKLKLNDPAFTFEIRAKESLGRGFQCGFLGSLHTEIISERLSREFNLNLIISNPSVVYKILNKKNKEIFISSPSDWPSQTEIKEIQEPWTKLELITPLNYFGEILEILKNLRGKYIKTEYLSNQRIILIYEVPLREIIADFYNNLKGVTQGYASMNYEVLDYRLTDLVKLEILIAGKKEESFSKIVLSKEAFKEGKKIVSKLKEILPPQLFSVPLQAAIFGKIIVRETIKPKRKDVTAPLYGGDYTRKKKLLERQKRGKKELAQKGKIRIPTKVFLEMFRG